LGPGISFSPIQTTLEAIEKRKYTVPMQIPLNTGQLKNLEGRQKLLLCLVELSVTLNSTLDLDELLQLIIETATELLECEAASILLYDEMNPRLYFAAATGSDPLTAVLQGQYSAQTSRLS
jgi:transcriptional regulator with GAF, ATPase, and Fis domain